MRTTALEFPGFGRAGIQFLTFAFCWLSACILFLGSVLHLVEVRGQGERNERLSVEKHRALGCHTAQDGAHLGLRPRRQKPPDIPARAHILGFCHSPVDNCSTKGSGGQWSHQGRRTFEGPGFATGFLRRIVKQLPVSGPSLVKGAATTQ